MNSFVSQACDNIVTCFYYLFGHSKELIEHSIYNTSNRSRESVNHMFILEATKIHKIYGNKFNKQEVLCGLDISIEKGEFVSIMGASGSGKTTLLNVLSSIDHISSGSIKIEGKVISGLKEKQLAEFRKNRLGFIFQEYNLLDTLTVKENILLPLSITKTPKKKPSVNFRR